MNKYIITGIVFVAIITTAFTVSNKNTPPSLVINEKTSTTTIAPEQKPVVEKIESKPVPTKPTISPTPEPTPTEPTIKSYTLSEISIHSDKASCWTTIGDKVYDITSYIPRHPGGEKNVLRICGKDGTSLFEGQHGGDSKPEKVLASFFIGNLTI